MADVHTTRARASRAYQVWSFLTEYSLLLIIGAVLALLWANIDYKSYHDLIEYNLWTNDFIGHLHHGHRELTVHYLINDVLMALFFAIAGKEVWEAVALKNGSLRGKKALTPLVATAGGMFGPIGVYFLTAFLVGKFGVLANGWAIPTATDIAFSYLVGRIVFGAGHPAVRFLLLLAIADDAAGLVIVAIIGADEPKPEWLLLSLAAALTVYFLANYLPRKLDSRNAHTKRGTWIWRTLRAWPYAIAGAVSWYGFQEAGLHPALGLLPIVPTIPHEDNAHGFFAESEVHLTDPLNVIEHALKTPVEIVLFLFGLANAGVAFTSMNEATVAVLAGLLIGKPLGIWLFGVVAADGLKLGLPEGMRNSDLFVLGCVAAIGFTVSLFMTTVAFKGGGPEMALITEGAKMGALLSFAAALMAIIAGRMFRVQKVALPT